MYVGTRGLNRSTPQVGSHWRGSNWLAPTELASARNWEAKGGAIVSRRDNGVFAGRLNSSVAGAMIGRTGDARGAFIGNTIKLIWEASHAQALRDHRVFSPAMKLTGLRRHPVFGGLPLEHIERLSTCASTRAYPRGAGRLAKQLLHLIGGVEGSG